MRSNAREAVFKIIYSRQFNNTVDLELKKSIFHALSLSKEDIDFAEKLLGFVQKDYDEYLVELDSLATFFSVQRIFPVDKSIIIMAMAEIKYMDDVPGVVSIDEAVSIVKKYSTANSCSFVNGILASYLKNQQKTNDEV